MGPSRRERLRAETIEDIKQAALEQIAESGPASLSMRGIARAIGMSPAGLYRYYEGIDALLTELIAEAYDDLADAVITATTEDSPPRERQRDGMLAYRRWGLEHPNRFLLIFGTPIPGYAAPEGGPTVAANRRVGEAFFRVAADAWKRGELAAPPGRRAPEPGEAELAGMLAEWAPGFPAELVGVLLGTWAHFHGLVTLEVLHQLDWIYPDPEVFYRSELERMLDGLMV
jgi:AcrR family transcriptional regulator